MSKNPRNDVNDEFVKVVLESNGLLEAAAALPTEKTSSEEHKEQEELEEDFSESALCAFILENYGLELDEETVSVLLQFADDFGQKFGNVIKEAKKDDEELEIDLVEISSILAEDYGLEFNTEDDAILESIVNFAIDYTLVDE